MSRGRPSTIAYADLALDRFRSWPLVQGRADPPPGRALVLPGRQIVHLHRHDLAEVHLTADVIERLTPALAASGRVEIPPAPGWIEVRLSTDSDLSLLESLVSLAIQANTPDRPHQPAPPCPQALPLPRRPANVTRQRPRSA